jgi:hypothetical protein
MEDDKAEPISATMTIEFVDDGENEIMTIVCDGKIIIVGRLPLVPSEWLLTALRSSVGRTNGWYAKLERSAANRAKGKDTTTVPHETKGKTNGQ